MFRIKAVASIALTLVLCLLSVSTGRGQPQETEILWDTWGVPHIYASSEPQAFRAFGYAQMEAHGDLLLKFYAAARGRAAEVYGAHSGTRCKRHPSKRTWTPSWPASTNTPPSIRIV
jgi:acyl-homoserine-lactone acylase